MYPHPQATDREAVKDFDLAVVVSGSRGWDDYPAFDYLIRVIMSWTFRKNKKVVFLSGAARSGADDLIIRWCRQNNCCWCPVPADWERYKPVRGKNPAGHIRNREMAELAKEAKEAKVIAFWDLVSPGTRNMIELANEYDIPLSIVTIDTPNTLQGGKSNG